MEIKTQIQQRITQLFADEFQLEIPATDTDLISEGLLDSLVFVDLIMHLERTFDTAISIDDLELDQFRTIEQMADFIVGRKSELVSA